MSGLHTLKCVWPTRQSNKSLQEFNEDSSSTSISIPKTLTSSTTVVRKHNSFSLSVGFIFGNNTVYKFWILSALLLLDFWYRFAGCVTLKWYSSTSLAATPFLDDVQFPTYDEIDILELGEREKVVRLMWEVYIERHNNKGIRLPKSWLHAFEAAFEYLVRDVAEVRDTAVSEIAKFSTLSVNLDPTPQKSTVTHVHK
ncbi:hypothetical protein ACFE04_026868 [Oxalis oulophora]